jgi:hypothetical protein
MNESGTNSPCSILELQSAAAGNKALTTIQTCLAISGTIRRVARCPSTSLKAYFDDDPRPQNRPPHEPSAETALFKTHRGGSIMYDMKPDRVGWTVFDVEANKPAVLHGLILSEFEHEDADELVARLNRTLHGQPKRLSNWPAQW